MTVEELTPKTLYESDEDFAARKEAYWKRVDENEKKLVTIRKYFDNLVGSNRNHR